MKRRELIRLLGGAAAAWPIAALAQQPDRMRRIGVLMGYAESDLEVQAHIAAFREGLQKLGWTEGRNIQIDTRWAAPDDAASMRLQPLANFMTNPAGAAIVNTTGPIRQIVDSHAVASPRFLVVAPLTAGKPGTPVQIQQ